MEGEGPVPRPVPTAEPPTSTKLNQYVVPVVVGVITVVLVAAIACLHVAMRTWSRKRQRKWTTFTEYSNTFFYEGGSPRKYDDYKWAEVGPEKSQKMGSKRIEKKIKDNINLPLLRPDSRRTLSAS